ncbi:uncharacterized protein LOC112206537 isoform X2 [Pan troglodytes]|uniref:uncharacterized protein LOC112206537 isoform X2 n=1 Tax=Pan troglodytes TaxID=9598 RepID=UPI0030134243
MISNKLLMEKEEVKYFLSTLPTSTKLDGVELCRALPHLRLFAFASSLYLGSFSLSFSCCCVGHLLPSTFFSRIHCLLKF